MTPSGVGIAGCKTMPLASTITAFYEHTHRGDTLRDDKNMLYVVETNIEAQTRQHVSGCSTTYETLAIKTQRNMRIDKRHLDNHASVDIVFVACVRTRRRSSLRALVLKHSAFEEAIAATCTQVPT